MNIFDHLHDHPGHPDQHQENTMTTPQQPQPQQPKRLVDSLHEITGEIQANPLVARLLQYGLGSMLTTGEADHITALIASLEQPRRVIQQHDDAVQQQIAPQP